MRYKAIFFDRDGTLTYFNPEKEALRDSLISAWSGKTFDLPYEKMMRLSPRRRGTKAVVYES